MLNSTKKALCARIFGGIILDFQAYNKILICPDDMRNVLSGDQTVGYSFKIKYPSYRGAFLSCIEELKFWVDGEAVPSGDVAFQLKGKEFLIDELPECFKEYWFVRDAATIRVFKDGGLPAGKHEIRVFMKHRVPYTGYFGEYLVLDSDVTETRELKEEQ